MLLINISKIIVNPFYLTILQYHQYADILVSYQISIWHQYITIYEYQTIYIK